jgi:hypothetical protein
MCRSIKPLRKMDHPATVEEIHEAALQYIRKVSGFRKPSQVNADVFEEAVQRVAWATRVLIENIQSGRGVTDSVLEPKSIR